MAANKIESELCGLSKSQTNLVQNILSELNLKVKHLSIEPLGKVGDNYATDVKVIKVSMDDNNEFKIIVKLNPSAIENAMTDITNVLFNNENLMYTEILPTMSQLQEQAGVELKDAFQFATCYGFSSERRKEILLLEDLCKHNYTILNKFESLPDETMKLVLANLADFHSLSYALKYSAPDKYKEFSEKLIDMYSMMGEENLKGYITLGDSFSQLFNDDKYKKLIKNIFSLESIEKGNKLKEVDAGSKYAVIVHGDMWTNNVLFHLEDGKPTKCIFIDYQIAREAMPVIDVLCLIFNCSDYETRTKHYYEWLDYYHDQLEKSLFNFGLRINNVYPRDKFESDMIRYAKVSLGMSIMVLSILLRKSEESAVFKDAIAGTKKMEDFVDHFQINTLDMESVVKIKHRIGGLIDSCYDFGLINTL